VDLGSSGLLILVAPLAISRVKQAVAANLDTLKRLLGGAGGHGERARMGARGNGGWWAGRHGGPVWS
jgi:hypothetical protein